MKGPCRNVLLRFRKFPNARETFKIFTCAKYPDIFSTDCTIIKKAFCPHSVLWSLSKDDDDGSENVSKNMNSRPFKLYRAYLDPLNVGDFSWSWFFSGLFLGSKRERKIRRRVFTSFIKRSIRRFHVVVVQWTSKKFTKKRDARAELLFCS